MSSCAIDTLLLQINFFILVCGVLFIFGENYLDGKAIVCNDANSYKEKYCWLHGAGYIARKFRKGIRLEL